MRATSNRYCSIHSIILCLTLMLGGVTSAAAQSDPDDVSIKRSIESTLEYHRQLKGIQENRQAAIHNVRRAEAGWYPSLDFTANAGRDHTNDPEGQYGSSFSDNRSNDSAEVGITLSQPLWNGLSTYHQVKAAELQKTSLDSRVVDTATTLALDAFIAHANVLLMRELQRYAEENVEQHIDILDDQRVLTNDGVSTVANLYQIEGRLSRARAQLVNAQSSLIEAEEGYLRVTGNQTPPSLQGVTMPLNMFTNAQNIYITAQEHNPKILAFISDSERAAELQKLATSAYQPNINLELSSARDHTGDNEATAMVVMRWNLFNGGADLAGERVAAAEYREVRQEAFDLSDGIKQESYNTWTRYTSSLEQRNLYSEAIVHNTNTRDSYLEQFLIGERGLLDVLDSYSELYNSSTQWVTMDTNAHIAAYTMFALAGGLLKEFNITDSSVLIAPQHPPELIIP